MPSSNFSADSLPDLKGRVYLVTGGNSGWRVKRHQVDFGEATVIGLASHGAKVYMAARSEAKATASIDEIRQHLPQADIHFLELDLGSFSSVVSAAARIRRTEQVLHGLVNNAGIMGTPFARTKDGFEEQWQTNYLSHWLLTNHLLPLLLKTARASAPGDVRIANLSSSGHQLFAPKAGIVFDDLDLESENGMTRYGQSKLGNVLHAKSLNTRYGPKGATPRAGEVWVASIHPGYIMTNLNNKATAMSPFGSTVALKAFNKVLLWVGALTDDQSKGALSSMYAIASPEFDRESSGAYLVPYAKVGTPSVLARDAELADRLWTWSEEEMRKRRLLFQEQDA
ncbi:putative short chain dehydrogenase protein [Seiridium cardinale]|uniref:Short chain dehydrogenase protein n=1 Tax=Seiridium cardinale TaxID=138064 RepID=A0ABR2XNZ0_9PEZI